MRVQEFRTDGVPAAERWGLRRETTARTRLPALPRSAREDGFRARVRVLPLGDVRVPLPAFPHPEAARTSRVVRRSDPDGRRNRHRAPARPGRGGPAGERIRARAARTGPPSRPAPPARPAPTAPR
ncbi:hypothetical protein GCM10010421_02030 [Streptomyces glaucus]|uniref:Uncharacterized protein n=1 Tax=Streptomyces glaucus TaxID=284029 RepID=A0ABN3J3J2_9ACTN